MAGLERATAWGGVGFGLALATFAAYQQFKLPPVLPVMLENYGYDRVVAGGFMSAYAVSGLLVSIGAARWIGRYGAYPMLLGSLGILLLANVAVLLAPESGWLVLAARTLEGLAFAVFAMLGPALANAAASPRHMALVAGLMATWIPIGQVMAALVAQPALARGDWTAPWWVAIALTLFFAWWVVRIRRGGGLPTRGGGAAHQARFTRRERLALVLTGLAFLLFSGEYYAYMTWLPEYLITVQGLNPDQALLGYLLPVVTLGFFNLVGAWLLRRGMDPGFMLALGMALQAACWWLLPVTGGGAGGIASLLVYGVGAGIAPTALFALPPHILGPGRPLVSAFALIMTVRNIGVFLGPIVLAELTRSVGGWNLSAPLFGAATTVSALLGVWLWLTGPGGSRPAR